MGFEKRGALGGFGNEMTGNDAEKSKSVTDSGDGSGVATATRNRRGEIVDCVNPARFVGDLLSVALNPLSLGMGDAPRARFGVLGVCGLVSNLHEGEGVRPSPEDDVTRLQIDLAHAPLPVSGGGN